MTIESLPKLTKAPVPEQTHKLKLEDRPAMGRHCGILHPESHKVKGLDV